MLKPIFASLLISASASAQPSDTSPTTTQTDPDVSITVSPLHLVIPMAEVTAELRLAAKVGVSVIGGVGMFRDQDTNEKIALYEAGGALRYYLTGSFRTGVQLGAEAVYIDASTNNTAVDVKASGLALSPFVGYKWTHHSGFTLEGQIGASYMAIHASSMTAAASESKVGPMLNLQVGWSI